MGFQRDNVLDADERAKSARKCLQILRDGTSSDKMSSKDSAFWASQRGLATNLRYAPSEPTLQWLRDLVERYVTN